MSFVYTCNCLGVHGIIGTCHLPTRRFIPTKVKDGNVCVYCDYYAVAEAIHRHPRGKGIGGYKPVAKPAALRQQHHYPKALSESLHGLREYAWRGEFVYGKYSPITNTRMLRAKRVMRM